MRTRLNSLCLLLLVLGVFATPLAAVADDATPPAVSPTEILAAASKRLAETSSMRFHLTVEGQTFIDDAQTIQLREARGDLVRPDQVRTDFKITVLKTATVTTSLIIIGDQRWSTDLITGKWGPAPEEFGYDPSILFDNQGGIGPVMDKVTDAQRLDDEKVGDREAFHIRAVVASSVIDPLTAGTMTGTPVTVDLWIAQDDFDLLRAKLSEPPVEGRESATWTLDLSDHGEDLKIEPPD